MKNITAIIALSWIFLSCSKQNADNTNGNGNNNPDGANNSNSWVELKSTEQDFGSGLYPFILTASADKSNLYVGGMLFGGLDGYFIAKWDGLGWSRLGTGATALNANNWIEQISCDNNGTVYATGRFTNKNGIRYIAKWNGKDWSSIGTVKEITKSEIDNSGFFISMLCDINNNLFVTISESYYGIKDGSTTLKEGIGVYKWNGNIWEKQGNTQPHEINSEFYKPNLGTDDFGNIYLSGDSITNGKAYGYLAKWNGINWTYFKGANNYLMNSFQFMSFSKNYGMFCKAMSSAGTISLLNWKDNTWKDNIYTDVNYSIGGIDIFGSTLSSDFDGNLLIAREKNDSVYIAKYDGTKWNNISKNIPISRDNGITHLVVGKSGKVYVVAMKDAYVSQVFMLKR